MEDLIVSHQIDGDTDAVEVLIDKGRITFKFNDYIRYGLTNAIKESTS